MGWVCELRGRMVESWQMFRDQLRNRVAKQNQETRCGAWAKSAELGSLCMWGGHGDYLD